MKKAKKDRAGARAGELIKTNNECRMMNVEVRKAKKDRAWARAGEMIKTNNE
ncbi:MAG: hypothetical protein AB1742_14380 [bacterium]